MVGQLFSDDQVAGRQGRVDATGNTAEEELGGVKMFYHQRCGDRGVDLPDPREGNDDLSPIEGPFGEVETGNHRILFILNFFEQKRYLLAIGAEDRRALGD